MFPVIDPSIGRSVLDRVRGCTFDDFILAPQRSVLARRDPAAIDLSVPPLAPHHAEAADRLGQHGHGHARADGDRAGRGRRASASSTAASGPARSSRRCARSRSSSARSTASSPIPTASRRPRRSATPAALMAPVARRHARRRRRRAAAEGAADRARHAVRERRATRASSDRMTPLDRLVVHAAPLDPTDAERMMVERKVKKLPLVDDDGALLGLITARDLMQPAAAAVRHARRPGPAARRRRDRRDRRLPRARRRARCAAGVDVLVIDIAHGHSRRDGARDARSSASASATSS